MARGVKGTGPNSARAKAARKKSRGIVPASGPPPETETKPYAVRLAERGGMDLPRPLDRSGGMAVPIGPHLRPPEVLDQIAAAEWDRVSELQGTFAGAGLAWISELDAATLAAYCQAWSVWVRAVEALRKRAGLVYRGREVVELKIERDARRALTAVARELGLTSMVRARIQAGMSGPEKTEEDDLLA